MSLTAFAVVREQEMATLEQIMVSPIRLIEFILGNIVPFLLIGSGNVARATTQGAGWIRVLFVGSGLVMLAGSHCSC
ncbi:hypothetical protein ACEPT7_03605 [Burkholderia ubonensis]|uniref:hypothetical protein n=1 Tax=Burkholderia ubonensis TaxID=101571 RepID=UPI00358F3DDD